MRCKLQVICSRGTLLGMSTRISPNRYRSTAIQIKSNFFSLHKQTVTLRPLVCSIHSLPVVHTLYMLFPTFFKNGEFASVKPRATDAPICYKNKLWKNATKKYALEVCLFSYMHSDNFILKFSSNPSRVFINTDVLTSDVHI